MSGKSSAMTSLVRVFGFTAVLPSRFQDRHHERALGTTGDSLPESSSGWCTRVRKKPFARGDERTDNQQDSGPPFGFSQTRNTGWEISPQTRVSFVSKINRIGPRYLI